MSRLLKSSQLAPVYTGTLEIPVKSLRQVSSEIDADSLAETPSLEEQIAIAKNECEMMIGKAKAEAQVILEQARQDAEKELENAKRDGFHSGYENGQAEAKRILETNYKAIVSHANEIVSQIESDRFQKLQNMSSFMTKVTMEAIRILLARELEMKEPDISSMVSELIQYVMDSSQIEVRVHPDDFPAAMAAHAKWKGMKFGDWEVAIAPDLQIGRGGCEIRSRIGRVDATMETRMKQLEEAVNRAILQLSAGEDNGPN